MKTLISIEGVLYKLTAKDAKRFEVLSSEPDRMTSHGNQFERHLTDALYSFLNEVVDKYKPVGILKANFKL